MDSSGLPPTQNDDLPFSRHSEPFMGEESILYNTDVDSSPTAQNDDLPFCHTIDFCEYPYGLDSSLSLQNDDCVFVYFQKRGLIT